MFYALEERFEAHGALHLEHHRRFQVEHHEGERENDVFKYYKKHIAVHAQQILAETLLLKPQKQKRIARRPPKQFKF